MDSHEVRRQWAERSGEYSPAYYAHYGPNDTSEWVRAQFVETVGREAAVLELGCSAGRHLAHLADDGFDDLTGIELNPEAFSVMADAYPSLAELGTFYEAAIEDVVETFEDGQFDAVFSVETLQHLHPDAAWVYDELVRITDDVLVTVEHEGDTERADESDPGVNYVSDEFPLYYRDWQQVFTERGLDQVAAVQGERDTRRLFRTVDAAR